MHAAFLERARLAPEATAMSWDGTNLTYRELARRADRVTAALLESGDVAGLPVAVRMAPGPGQVAALLGVLGAGAHLLCLGTGDTGSRGRESLSELRPVHLLQEGGTEDALTRWYRSELGGRVVDTDVLPTGVEAPERAPRPPAGLAYVAYTSGTTGRPKGIPQTDAALSQFVRWFATRFGVGPGSRVAQWAAPGYDAALVEVFAALTSGATLCPVPERTRTHPARLAAWLATERITLFQTVPSFARELTRVVARPGAGGIPELRHLLMAGETLPGELVADLQAALPATRLVNLYGPTESILATFHEISGPVRGHVPIGAPVPGRRILVVDEQDRRCPTGVTGHLVIHSPFVTPGRVGDGGGDAPEFRPLAGHGEALSGEGRYYRTGDLARVRWDGLLEFRGRGDSQIKFFGTRVELTEIETALSADASVSECAAVALPEADGLAGRLIVFVVPAPGSPEEGGPRSWLALLRRRFGASMPPCRSSGPLACHGTSAARWTADCWSSASPPTTGPGDRRRVCSGFSPRSGPRCWEA
ncbi:AMP-binding protein [Nocardiopsis eucommiae]|uniref:AMP-binding protein n=1 Tax=Nocardiopsis eucommiae TaxID=2831970 RepID=A0A975LBW1_9ACTN|nr:AMP-binding protein [Nocardiopsis eucommiae]